MSFTIIQADSHRIPLAANSVQCVVTSPPYWGLRDYGTATWVGGETGIDWNYYHPADRPDEWFEPDANHPESWVREGCDHKVPLSVKGGNAVGTKQTTNPGSYGYREWWTCGHCGATRIDSQIGLEKTPEEYVAKIVAVFAEVWRVLRDDGTCWVNLGDSYAGAPAGNFGPNMPKPANGGAYRENKPRMNYNGLKPKDLCGIPWRVAFALQAAGWYLRSDIIWSKPNPMPESVTDRPTKAHEYIFLLTKKERYYFDQDAVREQHATEIHAPGNRFDVAKVQGPMSRNGHSQWERDMTETWGNPAGRNIRTVWEIATQPYPEAHFATFPEEIAVRCIKAGTSEKGCCAECGAAWGRVTEGTKYCPPIAVVGERFVDESRGDKTRKLSGADYNRQVKRETTGWQPTCKHDAPTVPCIVLDPFSGAGTVPLVADKLNRRGIGLELKADYCRMAHDRCYDDAPLLAAMEG